MLKLTVKVLSRMFADMLTHLKCPKFWVLFHRLSLILTDAVRGQRVVQPGSLSSDKNVTDDQFKSLTAV